MPKLNASLQYRLHRRSGQAVVTLNDADHYLGAHGSGASRQKYDRLIAEWRAHGRHRHRSLTRLTDRNGLLELAQCLGGAAKQRGVDLEPFEKVVRALAPSVGASHDSDCGLGDPESTRGKRMVSVRRSCSSGQPG